jgi:hypothetical protein
VIRKGRTFSLLFAACLVTGLVVGCGAGETAKPDLPASVSPGWHLDSFNSTPKPAEVPESPVCWKANYTGSTDKGQSSAEVLICGYKTGGAFNAAQRVPAGAQAVKFEAGKYFVLVKWNNAPKTNVTALVRAIQKNLPVK